MMNSKASFQGIEISSWLLDSPLCLSGIETSLFFRLVWRILL
jgi:hypothetical protein